TLGATPYVTLHWLRPSQPALASWGSATPHGVAWESSPVPIGLATDQALRGGDLIALFVVPVFGRGLPPPTGNRKMSKNEASVPGISPISNDRFHLSTGAGDSPIA